MVGPVASTAAVSVINNRGNLGDTFDDTLSSDSLKGAALAAATAAASGWLDDAMNTSSNSVIDKTALDGVFKFVGRRAAQAGTDAALETAIQGGSFSDAVTHNLEGALATAFQAELFNQVGNLGMKLDLAESGPTKVALHALAGGLAAEATGSDFRSGAIAAGANEALVTQLAALVGNDPTLLVSASKITGILAAGMAGGDVEKGAEVAGNATAYNYLMHPEARRLQAINRLLEDDDTLTEAQRQSLEDERLEINIRSQSRDRALEQACGQGGSVSVCHYERAQLQVAMESWKGVPLGRDEQDTVLAEYIHTAGQYGQNQQQRMERIGAEALSEMAVDAASAPFILGSLVGQALLGDEESRATLQSVGEEIKALASDPANYISESNREQLARADALEQAGRLDDADKLRVRVALDNETMLMGTGGLLARLPRLARNVVTRSGMAGAGGISGGGKHISDAVPDSFSLKEISGGTLVFHENLDGHTIRRHVGKTDEQLLQRFETEPDILGSSTYPDLETAQRTVGDVLLRNNDRIQDWLKNSLGSRLPLNETFDYEIGRVIPQGSTVSKSSNKSFVLLVKDPLAPNGYRVHTSFPKPNE